MTPFGGYPPGDAQQAALRIRAWLLAHAQVPGGPHRGAVRGVLDADGRAAYVYPEITGYFLQWLAWRARLGDDRALLRSHADAASAWLRGWAGAAAPRTRIYFDEGTVDWRNDAVFCFDLAMVLRGLGSAVEEGLVASDSDLIASVTGHLRGLIAPDGELDACAARVHGIPSRWSTRRGAFLAKAATGILQAAAVLEVPGDLGEAANRTLEASLGRLRSSPHADEHPLLYAIEGALARQCPDPRHTVARSLQVLGKRLRASHGHAGWRSDVRAQFIRASVIVGAPRHPSAVGLDALVQDLCDCVTAEGGVVFSPSGDRRLNVWCAMFAEQALTLHASRTHAAHARRTLV